MATITISLPNQIAIKVDSEAQKHGFASRSEFIRSLLRRYFAKEQSEFEQFQPKPLEQIKLELAQTGKYNQEFIESIVKGLGKSSFYDR
ncbi:ribbon-helix-helix protein, CopG family [Candidatus Daviesbacteria bacterium]|nr:ribbon-helix-helix protein, CopG family [Candidatus Daviesbacteria bacterium]